MIWDAVRWVVGKSSRSYVKIRNADIVETLSYGLEKGEITMTIKIMKCTCKHDFQDEMYGAGNRVANPMRTGQFRCTVCGAVLGRPSTFRSAKAAAEPVKEERSSHKTSKDKKSKIKPKAQRGLNWGKK